MSGAESRPEPSAMPATDDAHGLHLRIAADAADAGRAAGADAGGAIAAAIDRCGRARVIFASAPSQDRMLAALSADLRVDWSRVEAFHMDEYLGLAAADPHSFGQWLADRLTHLPVGALHRIKQDGDPATEAERYTALLAASPIDLTCLGIGVNGHLAFNEPDDTDLGDPVAVRPITISLASRQQQVDECLFTALTQVPAHALTVTVPTLLSAEIIVATVLGPAKAPAVGRALRGPVDGSCPASALRTHARVLLHLDRAAAAELDR